MANPAMRASVTQVLSRVDRLPYVSGVVCPLTPERGQRLG